MNFSKKKKTVTTSTTTKIKTREKISSCHMDFQHGDGKNSFPNTQTCIIPAVEIMPLWQKKKTLPLSFNILLRYGWKKSFYMVKNTTKHLQYNSLLLWHWKHMVKIDNGIKSTKSKTLQAFVTTIDTEGTGDTVKSHIKESGNHFLIYS